MVSSRYQLLAALPVVVFGRDVVIVGAGVSGLTAARTLLDNMPVGETLTITVLEASNRIGGRTFTNTGLTDWAPITGAEVDQGASWIHGSNNISHPITAMANIFKWATLETKNALTTSSICTSGTKPPCTYDTKDNFADYKTLVNTAQATVAKALNDTSMWDAMGKVNLNPGRDDPRMQYAMGNTLEFEYGASPDHMSAWYYNDDKKMKGSGPELLLVKGYSQVSQVIQTGAIKLAAPCVSNTLPQMRAVPQVSQVPISVTMNKQVSSVSVDSTTNRIAVGTADGSSYLADDVIMSVPLGVLKANSITFTPALSAKKQTAIKNLWFGDLIKVGLLFDSVWWPDNTNHYFGLILQNGGGLTGLAAAEKFTYVLNTNGAGSGRPVLFTFVFGSSAMEVESWTDDRVWAAIRTNLVAIFQGYKDRNVTVPTAKPKMWRSNWGTNPLFGGVYASNAQGATPKDWRHLMALTNFGNGKLHFAGEHTNHDFRGTVHGAFWSGQRAACEVLWPGGKATLNSTIKMGVPNAAAAAGNEAFANAIAAGIAATTGQPVANVQVQLSASAPSKRVLSSGKQTLFTTYAISALPATASKLKSSMKAALSANLSSAVKKVQALSTNTSDDIDFDVEEVDEPQEALDIDDPELDGNDDETVASSSFHTGAAASATCSQHWQILGAVCISLFAMLR